MYPSRSICLLAPTEATPTLRRLMPVCVSGGNASLYFFTDYVKICILGSIEDMGNIQSTLPNEGNPNH